MRPFAPRRLLRSCSCLGRLLQRSWAPGLCSLRHRPHDGRQHEKDTSSSAAVPLATRMGAPVKLFNNKNWPWLVLLLLLLPTPTHAAAHLVQQLSLPGAVRPLESRP